MRFRKRRIRPQGLEPPPLSAKNQRKNKSSTAIVAVAGGPFAPEAAVIIDVVLTNTPIAVPVTFTEKVQDAFAARVRFDKAMLLEPPIAATVPPVQVPIFTPFGAATLSPGAVYRKKRFRFELPLYYF